MNGPREGLAFELDQTFLKLKQNAVFVPHQHLKHPSRRLNEDGRVLVHFIAGEEVLELIHRGYEVLEAKHDQVLLARFGIQLDLLLFLLRIFAIVPRIYLPPLLNQRIFVDLRLLFHKGQHSGNPSHDPTGRVLQKAVLDVVGGTHLHISDCWLSGGEEDG